MGIGDVSKLKRLSLAILRTVCLIGVLKTQEVMAKYEEPKYEVSAKEGKIELRQYHPRIAASVDVPGNGSDSGNKAFRILAGYIFGKNKGHKRVSMTVPVTEAVAPEKIAMTVPVTQESKSDGMRMTFYMPSKYTLESLPEPEDARIRFNVVPPERFAVIRFSGLASEGSINKHTKLLRAFINRRQLTSSGEPIKAFYNAPWTLPFLRRNEIWIPVQ